MKGPQLSHPHGTLVESLSRAAHHGRGVTFVDEDEHERHLQWSEALVRAGRAAAAYAGMGIRHGDRVALVLRTGASFLDGFLGAWLAGAVPVPLPVPARLGHLGQYQDALERMVRASGPRVLVTGGTTLRLLGEVMDRLRLPLGCRDVAELAETPARIHREVRPRDLGLVQFGWGGSATPRPEAFTHGALAAQVAARSAALGLREDDVLVSWLSVAHDTGLVGCLLTALARPLSLVLISRQGVAARPSLWLRAVARHRGTVTVAPASAYGRAARVPEPELERCALDTLRVAVARAEPGATAALRAFAERHGPRGLAPGALVQAYGLSEPALTVCMGAPGSPLVGARVDGGLLAREGLVAAGERALTPVGRPLPGVEVEVRDEGGHRLPDGRLGHLWIRAPALLEGTEGVGPSGWLEAGDLGFTLEGQLYLHGHRDEMVRVDGARHAPEEYEEPLAGLPGLGAAVALGLPGAHPHHGALLVVLEQDEGGSVAPAALEAAARRVLGERCGVEPGAVAVVEAGSLPRTGSGRLRRGETLRRIRAGTLAPPRGVNPVRLALDAARSQLAFARLRLRG